MLASSRNCRDMLPTQQIVNNYYFAICSVKRHIEGVCTGYKKNVLRQEQAGNALEYAAREQWPELEKGSNSLIMVTGTLFWFSPWALCA